MSNVNQKQLLIFINEGLSTREIASKINISQTNVRFWLKKFKLKTKPKFEYQNDIKLCRCCGLTKKMEEFYKKRDKNHPGKYPISYRVIKAPYHN